MKERKKKRKEKKNREKKLPSFKIRSKSPELK